MIYRNVSNGVNQTAPSSDSAIMLKFRCLDFFLESLFSNLICCFDFFNIIAHTCIL